MRFLAAAAITVALGTGTAWAQHGQNRGGFSGHPAPQPYSGMRSSGPGRLTGPPRSPVNRTPYTGFGAPHTGFSPQHPGLGEQPPSSATVESAAALKPEAPVTLIFNDGRPPEHIHNYLLTSTKLTVVDAKYREIPLDQINIAATEEANRSAGIDFRVPHGSR